MKVNVKLLQSNRLIGTRVHSQGDIVEMDQEKAKEWVKRGHAAVTNEAATPIPVPPPRFAKNNFPITRTASDPAAAAALREAELRDAKKPKGVKVA